MSVIYLVFKGSGSGAVEHVAMEIESLLARLTEVVEAMEVYMASNTSVSGNPTMVHTLERHSEILNDYKREYRKKKVRKGFMSRCVHLRSVPCLRVCRWMRFMELRMLSWALVSLWFLQGSLSLVREQNELLSAARLKEKSGATTGHEALYAERNSAIGATSAVDSALAQGTSLREQLEHQRAMFASMMQRVSLSHQ